MIVTSPSKCLTFSTVKTNEFKYFYLFLNNSNDKTENMIKILNTKNEKIFLSSPINSIDNFQFILVTRTYSVTFHSFCNKWRKNDASCFLERKKKNNAILHTENA